MNGFQSKQFYLARGACGNSLGENRNQRRVYDVRKTHRDTSWQAQEKPSA